MTSIRLLRPMTIPLEDVVIPSVVLADLPSREISGVGGRTMDWSSAVVVQLRPFVQDSEGLEWCNRETAFLSSLSLV